VTFRFLHPSATSGVNGQGHGRDHDNDSSCVLEVSTGARRILLTGDIETAVEQELERQGLLARTTVVVAPHHGSRTSSSSGFVAATRPELVVFSVGYRNRWGFPRPEIVERWHDAGARTLRTDASGAVIMRLDGDGLQSLTEHRRAHRRYWRAR
jgi:competence protein ComEC